MVPPNQAGESPMNTWFKPSLVKVREEEVEQRLTKSLASIESMSEEFAGNLSGTEKVTELGRTMMVDAKIVFLDEVGAGVNRTPPQNR